MFDSGARNSYVMPAVAAQQATSQSPHPFRTALGGMVQETSRTALLEAKIDRRPISTHAMVLDHIGVDEQGKEIEALLGTLAMQQWEIASSRSRKRSTYRIIPTSM